MTSPPPVGVSAAGGDGRVFRRCDGRYILMMMHSFIFHSFIFCTLLFYTLLRTSPVGECLDLPTG